MENYDLLLKYLCRYIVITGMMPELQNYFPGDMEPGHVLMYGQYSSTRAESN